MEKELIEKKLKINQLLTEVNDRLVDKFFDEDSNEFLDEKIDVLTKLSKGIPPSEIDNYYKILELYPQDNIIWD